MWKRVDIPKWLAEDIDKNRPYCEHPITNNDALTDRYCSNEKCPEHMAQKIVILTRQMGIKDSGITSACEAVRLYELQLHTQILSYWLRERPSSYLHEVEKICLIKGYQMKWRQYCEEHGTMMQVVKCPRTPPEIRKHAVLFICTTATCNTKSRLLDKRLNVILSGPFDGYRSRSDFVAEMNHKYGDVIQMVDVGERKTEAIFLVKEIYAINYEKSTTANAMGIPTITPRDLDGELAAYKSYITKGGRGN